MAQHRIDVEPGMQPDPRARVERRRDVQQAENVRRRRHDLHAVGRGQVECRPPVRDGDGEGAVSVPRGLRHARRARTEHEQRVGVGVGRGEFPRTWRDGVVEVQHRHHLGQHRMVADRMCRGGQGKGMLDLGSLPCRAQQDDGAAETPDRTHRDDELGAVGGHQRDAVTGAHAALLEHCRHAAGQRIQLGSGVLTVPEGEQDRLSHVAPLPAGHRRTIAVENILSIIENGILGSTESQCQERAR